MSQLSATGQLTVSDNGYAPRYELRATRTGLSDTLLEVWQLPSTATPHLRSPRRIAGLGGRNLGLVEHRLARQLKHSGIDLLGLMAGETRRFDLDEDQALRLGLMFRVLAPMRSRSNMQACAQGIEAMGKEEAAYWLGMAMHRKYPRRVLMALRFLLIDPKNG
jgi:hypothetical protein